MPRARKPRPRCWAFPLAPCPAYLSVLLAFVRGCWPPCPVPAPPQAASRSRGGRTGLERRERHAHNLGPSSGNVPARRPSTGFVTRRPPSGGNRRQRSGRCPSPCSLIRTTCVAAGTVEELDARAQPARTSAPPSRRAHACETRTGTRPDRDVEGRAGRQRIGAREEERHRDTPLCSPAGHACAEIEASGGTVLDRHAPRHWYRIAARSFDSEPEPQPVRA
jgi:hypothetical protein